jgi:hypothetical protein
VGSSPGWTGVASDPPNHPVTAKRKNRINEDERVIMCIEVLEPLTSSRSHREKGVSGENNDRTPQPIIINHCVLRNH